MTIHFIDSPLGKLKITLEQNQVIALEMLHSDCHPEHCHPERSDRHPERNVCHPERSEGSISKSEILRCAQDDSYYAQDDSYCAQDDSYYAQDDNVQDDSTHINIHKQLHTYFTNPSHSFTVNLNPAGTDFQRRVWQALQSIPSGTTLTYGELARQLGSSPRAVGQACRRNPIPIIIPCHRVVASKHLGGYAGAVDGQLLSVKKWLLTHEGIN